MEKKKTERASIEGMKILFFLIGLNLVLLTVWILFGMQTPRIEFNELAETIEIRETPPDAIILKVEPPIDEVDLPEEPPMPEPTLTDDIIQIPDPVIKPKIPEVDIKIPIYHTDGDVIQPKTDVNLRDILQASKDIPKTVLEPISAIEVDQMAVYPGCEKYTSKTDLINCFGDELSKDIIRELDKEFPDVDKDVVAVQLSFLVNTKGEIVNINPKHGDQAFKRQAKEALEKVARRLKKKGKTIEPAKMNTGDTAILKFQRNVKLQKP